MKTVDWQKVSSDLAALARPVRMFVWMFLLIGIVTYVLFTGGKTDNTGLMFAIVAGIFADFGVNSILRTEEKKTITKTEGATKVAETVTQDGNGNTHVDNINVGNDTVNMPVSKEPVG